MVKVKNNTRGLLVIDISIIALFIIIVIGAVITYIKNDSVTANYGAYEINPFEERVALTSINFTSENVFAIHQDIRVQARAEIDPIFLSKNPDLLTLDKVYFYLPTAIIGKPYYERGHLISEYIELIKQPDGTYQNSTAVIKYESEGGKCYIFSLFKNLERASPSCPPYTIITYVASLEVSKQQQTNRNVEFLSWIILAFTILIIENPLKNMISNISTVIGNKSIKDRIYGFFAKIRKKIQTQKADNIKDIPK